MAIFQFSLLYFAHSALAIRWIDNWALGCDFPNNGLSSIEVKGDRCSSKCTATLGCTHFTWNTFNDGTCWMKKGPVSKKQAVDKHDEKNWVCGINPNPTREGVIEWNGNWAFGCDFAGNDLKSLRVKGEDCGGRCSTMPGCTHFTWTNYMGGTCWLKQGAVTKEQAISRSDDRTIVCGVNPDSKPAATGNGVGPLVDRVFARQRNSQEPEVCKLPADKYASSFPLALGDSPALRHLQFRPELCGQVLRIDCGKDQTLDVIVTTSNPGSGLGVYASAWNKLTNSAAATLEKLQCTVQLTNRNTFDFEDSRCYYKPDGPFDDSTYRDVGLLNTKGKLVLGATLNGLTGAHNGQNPYFAIIGGLWSAEDPKSEIVFSLDDGTVKQVKLQNCKAVSARQQWS